ncbi:agrin-like isoform X4 [Ruditapes philippinarum]|uniref:agrin-like isoform X4 n=1 Tax=Ruditapes philippinarum TaxID=129788 RepID=UPI00295B1F74|nr:agrin-like isoform X4 [Ruditapes philippinarum]
MEVIKSLGERNTVHINGNKIELKTKMKTGRTFMKTSLDFRDAVSVEKFQVPNKNCLQFNKKAWLISQACYKFFHRVHSFWCLKTLPTSVALMLLFQLFAPICESCYVFPPGKKNPCANMECELGAVCVSSKDGLEARCVCPRVCHNYGDSDENLPVCGNNDKDYDNYCELRKDSCKSMKEIKVKHYGNCDPCEKVKCNGQEVCEIEDHKPICRCQKTCEDDISPICGSDKKTYGNLCLLKQQACRLGRDISALYDGKCQGSTGGEAGSGGIADDNPCSEKRCETYQLCVIDRLGQASCICPSPCQQLLNPVCSSDGVTYDNECELRRQACIRHARIYVAHTGPCEDQGPCLERKCTYDADCIVQDGRSRCVCPNCSSEPYDPMCGNNGITYENDCERRQENCQRMQVTQVEHRGHCMDCTLDNNFCKYYSTCETSDGLPRCVCPTNCTQSITKVCGTDGNTYNNDCELMVASCKNRKHILLHRFGDCENCNGVQCKYGADCVHGTCVCPQVCPHDYQSVCASDEKTYRNACEMRKEACRLNKELEIVKSGECHENEISGSGEGSGSDCEDSLCERYGGTCYLDMEGISRCSCSFSCDAVRSPVCGSDGVTYGNKCELDKAACNGQKRIVVQSMDSCDDMDEVLCDGLSPVLNSATGLPYACTGGHDCPSGSYCHVQFRKCCNEERLSDIYIEDCSESVYGCCDDHVTFAPGPDKSGCPDQCQCNPMGSLSTTCHPVNKNCTCKPNVGGPKCDRCEPGYWGLALIHEDGKSGCMECLCDPIGASRKDCQQNTGRCLCKSGYDGHKCGRCISTGRPAGSMGCEGGQTKSCGDLICYYGATCSDQYKIPQCFCDFHCPEYDFPTTGYMCATNGLTYLSECSLKKEACKRQQDIKIAYNGPCRDVLTLGPTDVPYTPRSRKTTRHIQASNYMTPKKLDPTVGPPIYTVDFHKYGRIGDLCLEDSYCFIPNSHCYLALCQCNDGYIPTYENTQCSKVIQESTNEVIPDEMNTCTLSPCLHQGVCKLDDNIGFRCLCKLGRTGNICNKRTSFSKPSFSGSSYLTLQPLGNITEDFYLDIAFQSFNRDGILLFSSQNEDGTGQFISIAISGGYIEFRYDTGNGPKQIRHPYEISKHKVHQVIAKKMGQKAMLIVDNMEPVVAITIATEHYLDLSGRLYLGYLPQNLSFVSEKVGVNQGFVGCVEKLTAGHMDMARIFNLQYPSSSTQIVDGLDVGPCEENPCGSMPCLNGATCIMLNKEIYQCLCFKGYKGSNCEEPIDICTNSPCHPSATCSLADTGEILCHCPESREGQYCEYEKLAEIEVPEFGGDSFLVLPISDNLSEQTSIDIWFLTKSSNGMLLYASQYLGGQGDFLSLNIDDRYVELRFDLGDDPVVIRSTDRLKLDKWHKVSVKRTAKDAELIIDDGLPDKGSSQGHLTGLQFTGSLYVGGFKDKRDLPTGSHITDRFRGVIQRIYINGKLIEEPISSALETLHVSQYTGPPCRMNPCLNGGVCIPNLDKVDCKCPKRFIGQLCEKAFVSVAVAENLETSRPVRFNTETYLQYYNEIMSSQPAQKVNKYQFRFRTHQLAGLLIFQGQGPTVSDYIALVISDGYVELSYNLGKQSLNNLLRARSSVFVSDGEWHTVHAERDHREGRLQVDKEPMITTTSDSGATQLDTDGMLWIGGRRDLPTGLPQDYYKGFKGCLGFVFILDKPLHLYDHRNGLGSTMEFCHL